MVFAPTTVQPGDLIRAELMNQMLSELATLDQRVTALEALGGPATGTALIAAIVPTGPIRIGQEMQVLGYNFQYTIGAQRAFIDGIQITTFKSGSTDQKLIFDVPSIPNVPDAGKAVVLSVSNQTTTDTRTINLLPAVIALGGNVDVSFESVDPATIAAGGAATFRYRVRSRANASASFTITATVSNVSNASDWQSQIKILNDDETQNGSATISLSPNEEKLFKVRITIVPATPAAFRMTVSVGASGVTTTPDSRTFNVGSLTDQPDPTTSLDFQSAMPVLAYNSGTVTLAANGAMQISLLATFTTTGTFRITQAVTSGSGWTTEAGLGTPTTDFQITSADLSGPPPHTQLYAFVIRAQSSPSATATAELRLERVGGLKRVFPLNLVKA